MSPEEKNLLLQLLAGKTLLVQSNQETIYNYPGLKPQIINQEFQDELNYLISLLMKHAQSFNPMFLTHSKWRSC